MPDIEDLMKALLSDETLRQKLSDSESPEKAVRVAKEAGYTISKNELLEVYKAKMATMSEEELANVVGGKTVTSNQGGNQQNQSDGNGGEPQQQGGNVQINISS